MMANVIVNATKLSISLSDVIDRWRSINKDFAELMVAKVEVDKGFRKVCAERDCLLGKHKGMLEKISQLEFCCKVLETKALKVEKEGDALCKALFPGDFTVGHSQ